MQNSIPYVILGIVILVGILAIAVAVRRKEEEEFGQDKPQDQALAASAQAGQEHEKAKNKLVAGVTIGLVILAIGGVMVNIFIKEKGLGNSGSSDTSFAPFIPIWIAIFIPILARRKKEPLTESKKKLMAILVAVTFLLVLGTIALFFLNK